MRLLLIWVVAFCLSQVTWAQPQENHLNGAVPSAVIDAIIVELSDVTAVEALDCVMVLNVVSGSFSDNKEPLYSGEQFDQQIDFWKKMLALRMREKGEVLDVSNLVKQSKFADVAENKKLSIAEKTYENRQMLQNCLSRVINAASAVEAKIGQQVLENE